ncbi:hypothetical protein GYB59_23255 [bacterium]|nr:hypothetical protein [bacterium]
MQYFNSTATHANGPASRQGATLVEILMSLMVMSIGLVSVASLFPLSMMRSIQATQLTNAAMLHYQCEDYTRAFPGLTFNHYDGSGIVPNSEMQASSPTIRRFREGAGAINPTVFLRSLPLTFVKVVDPIGASFYRNTAPADAITFGKDPYGLHDSNTNFMFQATRTNAGFDVMNLGDDTGRNLAFSMFGSTDSWSESVLSNEITIVDPLNITLDDIRTDDMASFAGAIGSVTGRAIIYDRTGKQSHVTQVTNVAGQNVQLTKAIPNNGLYTAIPEVRLELLEPRYTCLITVRRQLMNLGPDGTPGEDSVDDDGDGTADNFPEIGWPGTDDEVRNLGADLVVFFRRDFSPFGEQVYEAGNLIRGSNAPNGTQPITIRWDGGKEDSRPRLQSGGWVFDPVNGYWYQLTSVLVEDRPATDQFNGAISNMREAVVLLDRPPEASGRYLMVPERVVEVFDFPAF